MADHGCKGPDRGAAKQIEGKSREHRHPLVSPQNALDPENQQGAQGDAQADDHEPLGIATRPTIGDVRRGIGANSVEAPLAKAELAVETVDQVQTERHHGDCAGLE